MKKIFTILAVSALTILGNAQTFTATYGFDGAPPVVTGVLAGDGAANVTASSFTSVGVSQTDTGNRYANTGAPVGALDLTKYVQVTLTPVAGQNLSVSSISFRSQRSGTGPRSYVVRSSADNYAANLPASISPANAELEVLSGNVFHYVNDIKLGQNGNLVSPTISGSSAVTFRFYFFDAEATNGTFSVDDVIITGNAGNLSVSDVSKANSTLVKNTVVSETLAFAKTADIQIVNTAGQVVKSAKVTEGSTLNVSSLAKGTYIVTGTVNGERVSQKVIKN